MNTIKMWHAPNWNIISFSIINVRCVNWNQVENFVKTDEFSMLILKMCETHKWKIIYGLKERRIVSFYYVNNFSYWIICNDLWDPWPTVWTPTQNKSKKHTFFHLISLIHTFRTMEHSTDIDTCFYSLHLLPINIDFFFYYLLIFRQIIMKNYYLNISITVCVFDFYASINIHTDFTFVLEHIQLTHCLHLHNVTTTYFLWLLLSFDHCT